MTYQPPETTDYNGIPLGGDDLAGGPIIAGENNLPDVDESQIGVLQEVAEKDKVPLATDLLGNDSLFKTEEGEESQEETKAETQPQGETKAQEGSQAAALRLGDQDIPEDAKLVINGQELTAKEVVNSWKTTNEIRAEIGKLGGLQQLQKDLPEREALVQKQIKSLKDAMTMLDGSLDGQRKFLLSGGIDPYQYEEKIKTELRREIERESELSAEELASERIAKERQRTEEERKSLQDERDHEKTRQKMAGYQQQVAQSYNIQVSEMETAFEQVKGRLTAIEAGSYQPGVREKQVLSRVARLQGKELIAEVGKLAWETKNVARVNQAIDKIDSKLKNGDKYNEVMQAAFAEIANPYRVSELSEEDLIGFLKARFNLVAANPDSEQGVGPKEENEKADGVEVVEEVTETDGGGEQKPLSAEELLNW